MAHLNKNDLRSFEVCNIIRFKKSSEQRKIAPRYRAKR